MRILILGAGAVGGYFGGRLVEARADVTFLVRPGRAEQLARSGLTIQSHFGNVTVPVNCITSGAGAATFDIVIVACKAYDLKAAMSDIAPYVNCGAAVLPMLNGIAHLDLLSAAFGPNKVLGGSCHIGATATPSSTIHHLNKLHAITFGELTGERTKGIGRFRDIIGKAKVDA